MHYIRLLRPPSLESHPRGASLKLVFTITTDLGDSFLRPDEPVPITVYLSGLQPDENGPKNVRLTTKTRGKSTTLWSTGLRVLKLDLPVPPQLVQVILSSRLQPQIRIVASDELDAPSVARLIPFDKQGRIMPLAVQLPKPGEEPSYIALRQFTLRDQHDSDVVLEVEEEIGESIDRHVWDAGVVTMGLISGMCAENSSPLHSWDKTPLLKQLLTRSSSSAPFNVIELGCGVGILGLGLAAALHRRKVKHSSRILLTDLPDAEELARSNIQHLQTTLPAQTETPRVDLDFESLDWEHGKVGSFGNKSSSHWGLIIISDCTYNVDMLSALVMTISALHRLSVSLSKRLEQKRVPKVLLATKPRHSSEKALFDLMAADGWSILESASQPLPVLGADPEAVDLYLFGKE